MTVMGKILAIVNLVFSLAVAAFIVMTFVARTTWHDAFNEVKNQLAISERNVTAFQADADETRKLLTVEKNDRTTEVGKITGERDTAKAEAGRLRDSLAIEQNKVQQRDNSLNSNVAELQSREKEVQNLKVLVAQRDALLKNKEADLEQALNLKTEYEIARNSEHERNLNLLTQLEKLSKDVQKAQQSGGTVAAPGAATRKNPPAEDIEGLVKATDPENGYVTLTIGSDTGLAKGNTLDVFRLKPDPAYLGTVEILAVRHDQAVAKPLGRMRGTIQVGDQVSSNIGTRR